MTLKNATKWMTSRSISLLLAACAIDEGTEDTGSDEGTTDGGSEVASGDFDTASDIHVITREDGSGTRGAFVEIAGVVDENEDDITTATAKIGRASCREREHTAGARGAGQGTHGT